MMFPTINKTSTEIAYDERFQIVCPQGSTSPLLQDEGEWVFCVGGTTIRLSRTDKRRSFADIKCRPELPATTLIKYSVCQTGGILV
ncbi:hypothetical protein Zmor_024776 [Zophobas morio]|uniref:Uncharacterized protein n=1 Tax=Zophobas morio TaxID=2755281 RepID=A0AA38I3U3_9CUCU|nr:hypothetical protein Zmor_024776 [Zophobas morio]